MLSRESIVALDKKRVWHPYTAMDDYRARIDPIVVDPDLICTAKGFCGGMLPMAATLVSARVFEGFLGSADRAFYYGHSFCGNPLGAAVALEVLRIYREELPSVARSRSLGMIGAVDLSGDEGYLARAGWRVYDEARSRGAYLRPMGNLVYVTPPLNIPDEALERLLAIVRESIESA